MSAESVRAWLAGHAPDLRLIEVEQSTATVASAAAPLGVGPGRVARTLAVGATIAPSASVARAGAIQTMLAIPSSADKKTNGKPVRPPFGTTTT